MKLLSYLYLFAILFTSCGPNVAFVNPQPIFLDNLEEKNYLDNINLVILSDHGSRIIKNNNDSMLSVIYASRNKDTKYKEIKEKALSQNIFIER